jgi:CRISPR-associated endonuclease/helicase Cas3
VDHAGTTAVLCTATQPLLDNLRFPEKGQLNIPAKNELVDNMAHVFEQLQRVEIVNKIRPGCGWSDREICELAVSQMSSKGNCLVIVNTKKWARKLYDNCAAKVGEKNVFHLSTSLCPAHRQEVLAQVRNRLDTGRPVLCISTQLIEAGVDIDFNAVIRFLAGLDSIAQAAGRCNRNGNRSISQVYVINPADESIENMDDIKIGRDKALRIFSECKEGELLHPEVMAQYFSYYFYERSQIMDYPLTPKQAGRNDTLLNLLSLNSRNIGRTQAGQLRQSFKTAGKAFKAIDAPTKPVIVQYGEGKDIVAELCGAFEPAQAYQLLKQAQKFSVNVFPNVWKQLLQAKAVFSIQGEELYFLDEQYYSKKFGLATEVVNDMSTLITGGI